MAFLVSLVLPFAVSLLLAGGAALLWGRSLASPFGFAFLGFVSMLGVYRLVEALSGLLSLFGGGGYFLEHRPVQPAAVELVIESLTRETVAIAVVSALLGLGLLFWLKQLFRA